MRIFMHKPSTKETESTSIRNWDSYYLNALMDYLPDVIFFKDRESRFIRINKAMAEKFGLSGPEEAIGKTDRDFFKFDHADDALDDEQEVMRTGQPIIDKEEVETWPNKPSNWVSTTKLPLRNDQGEIIGTFGISRDISLRKLYEASMLKRVDALTNPAVGDESVSFEVLFDLASFQRFQDEFSNATGVACITTRPDGTPLTNPSNFTRFCQCLVRETEKGKANCFKSDACLGAPNPKGPTIQPCLSGGLWDAGASIIVGGQHIANWLIGQVRDETQTDDSIRAYAREIGVEEDLLLSAFNEVPSMSHAKFLQVAKWLYAVVSQLSLSAYQNLMQARHIAERQVVEKALQESEERLKELVANKDKFFSIIAHDLKTPFNCILGYSDLLVEKVQQEEFGLVKEYTERIRQASLQSMNLLGNLLEWSRSQTGRIAFVPQCIDLVCLVDSVMDLMADTASQKGVELKSELLSPVMVNVDEAMLGTVLRNLVSNAIKFTKAGGMIRLSAEMRDTDCLVSVSDTGVGITTENQSKLFRVDQHYTTNGTADETGSGLGLLLCKEFIQKHGGAIWVESEVNKGSVFRFTVPPCL